MSSSSKIDLPKRLFPGGKAKYHQISFQTKLDANQIVEGYWHGVGKVIQEEVIPPYILNDHIFDTIKLAMLLKRPIFVKGDPGGGKTQLARALAYYWYGDDFRKHYFEWFIKSTSKASDGLYKFDHLARLRDTQAQDTLALEKVKDKKNYRTFGPMGQAFLTSTEKRPSILLIDEIDKAEVDFPNDILLELDEKRFFIPETEEHFEALHAPIIFITSNDERPMPQAFLRRCLFLYLEFPNKIQLEKIIEAHLPDFSVKHQELVKKLTERFIQLRNISLTDPGSDTPLSTSNLLEWIKAIELDPDRSPNDYEPDNLPFYYAVLLKSKNDLTREGKL